MASLTFPDNLSFKVLKTETETRTMQRRVLAAFRVSSYCLRQRDVQAVFEHGQWWIVTGSQIFSVVDANGGPAIDGFDFEAT